MKTVTVLCENDFPHAVYEDAAEAEGARRRLAAAEKRKHGEPKADGHLYKHYHANEVPFYAKGHSGN